MNQPSLELAREHSQAGMARRFLDYVGGYAAFWVVTVFALLALTLVQLVVSVASKPAGEDAPAEEAWTWVDTAIKVGGWFVGMLGGLLVHRLLSRRYSLVTGTTRCGSCGMRLSGLKEPACPGCGVRL